jgi:hypothetical protein
MVLVAPSAALGSVQCHYSPARLALSVTASGGSEATIRRAGPEIRVSESFEPPLTCASVPVTVTGVDSIEVIAKVDSSAWIELAGGPFAPGATAEADGSPEIEFTLSGADFAEVIGGRGADHFKFLRCDGHNGVNLNANEDNDLDVTVVEKNPAFFVAFNGGGGADLLDAGRNPGPSMFAVGGTGDDTLIAGGREAILLGEAGRDRIFGSPVGDLINPGRGADLVKARGGADALNLGPDHARDRIDCGPGRDGFALPDPLDRLRSCEIDLVR